MQKYPIFALMVSVATMFTQEVQSDRVEEASKIERSLEYFYKSLQNLFIGYEENPIDCNQNQKMKFDEIGYYKHLAKKGTRYYFEIYAGNLEANCILNVLLEHVKDDIYILQERYDELNQP